MVDYELLAFIGNIPPKNLDRHSSFIHEGLGRVDVIGVPRNIFLTSHIAPIFSVQSCEGPLRLAEKMYLVLHRKTQPRLYLAIFRDEVDREKPVVDRIDLRRLSLGESLRKVLFDLLPVAPRRFVPLRPLTVKAWNSLNKNLRANPDMINIIFSNMSESIDTLPGAVETNQRRH